MTCEATCSFTGCRAHSALMGDGGTGSFISSDPPDPTSPPSEISTQLLLGKRGGVSSGYFLLTVGKKSEGRCRGTRLRG
jgi:hypothetical protein